MSLVIHYHTISIDEFVEVSHLHFVPLHIHTRVHPTNISIDRRVSLTIQGQRGLPRGSDTCVETE